MIFNIRIMELIMIISIKTKTIITTIIKITITMS